MQCFAAREFKSTITYKDGTNEVIDYLASYFCSTIQKIIVDTTRSYSLDDNTNSNCSANIQFEALDVPNFVKIGSEIFYECKLPYEMGLDDAQTHYLLNWTRLNHCCIHYYKRLLDGDYARENNSFLSTQRRQTTKKLSSRYEKLKLISEQGYIVRITNGTVKLITDPASL